MAIGALTGIKPEDRGIDLIHIANIQDANEVTHHLLEIISTHLLMTRVNE